MTAIRIRAGAALLVPAAVLFASSGSAAPAAGAQACVPVPPLSAAAKQTLAAEAAWIEAQSSVARDGTRSQTWSDPLSGRFRQLSRGFGGKIQLEFVMTGARSVWVFYDDHRWTSQIEPQTSGATPGNSPAGVAHRYRELIAGGEAKVLGPATIDGVATLHLRQFQTVLPPNLAQLEKGLRKQIAREFPKGETIPKKLYRIPAGTLKAMHLQLDIWVDAATYLPLRIRTVANRRFSQTEADDWLPRTVANLAKLKVVIPAGFDRQRQTGQAVGFDSWSLDTSSRVRKPTCRA